MMWKLTKCVTALLSRRIRGGWALTCVCASQQGLTAAPSRRVRRLQLSFRFWLALTLHRNPTLRKYRRWVTLGVGAGCWGNTTCVSACVRECVGVVNDIVHALRG